jgi:two-component system NtrC family sensor kinase
VNGRRTDKGAAAARGRLLAEDYYDLSNRILRYGNRGTPRGDFLREVSKLLVNASACDAVEFRLRDSDFNYFSETTGKPDYHFRFGAIDGATAEGGKKIPCSAGAAPAERLCREVIQGRFGSGRPCFTKNGTFWTGDAPRTTIVDIGSDGAAPGAAYTLGGEYRSWVVAPFAVGEEDVGLLLLKSRQRDFFSAQEAEFYEGVAQSVGVAVADRRAHWRLRERVKEMTCLYGIAELASRPGISTDDILRGIVALLPPAMQYPEITIARVDVDGVVRTTEDFEETPYKLSADVVVNGDRRGAVEVQYKEATLDYEPGIFLQEEQSLLDAVARQIGLILENRRAEEERAQLQEQLRHADRLATIGLLAAGVAHELNEPLASVLSFAELLKEDPGLSYQGTEDLDKILAAALHAREVVRKLLFFAREVPTIKQAVDVSEAVEEALSLLASRFGKENVDCVLNLSRGMPKIIADPAQLHQVIVNLVVNAVQAMPGGGKLTITTAARDEFVYLVVEDTGVGMTEEVKKNIFLPFFTTKEISRGTGLGLPVVHGIVTSHGGAVDVASEPGRGSRFEVRLPLGPTSRAAVVEADNESEK